MSQSSMLTLTPWRLPNPRKIFFFSDPIRLHFCFLKRLRNWSLECLMLVYLLLLCCILTFDKSHQLEICRTGCCSCVNKRSAHVGWQTEADHVNHKPEECIGVMKLYIYAGIDGQIVNHGQSAGQAVKRLGVWPENAKGGLGGAGSPGRIRLWTFCQRSKDVRPCVVYWPSTRPNMPFQSDALEGSDTFQWPVIERNRIGGFGWRNGTR